MYTDLFWKLRPEMLAFLQLEDMSAVDLEAYCFQSLVVVRGAVIVMYVLKQELLTVFVQKKRISVFGDNYIYGSKERL